MSLRPSPTLALFATLIAAFILGASPALAIDEQSETSVASTKSVGEYLSDLEGDSAPDRLYASRVLRGNLKRALRVEATAREGTLIYDDARAVLVELEVRLPTACMSSLNQKNVVSACADILAMLDVRAALPSLQALLAGETRKPVRKRIELAIATLTSPGLPSATPGPAAPSAE